MNHHIHGPSWSVWGPLHTSLGPVYEEPAWHFSLQASAPPIFLTPGRWKILDARGRSPASSSPQPLLHLWLMSGLLTQAWPSTNSPLPPIYDRLRTLASGPRICLPHLLHLCPALQCQTPGKQGHSPRPDPSPATKELSEPCPSPQFPTSAVGHGAGSSPRPPRPLSHLSCRVHFPCFRLLLKSGPVGGFFSLLASISASSHLLLFMHAHPHTPASSPISLERCRISC